MRRILITLVIFIVCIAAGAATWIFGGRQLSLFMDRFGTIETTSTRIDSIAYEGSGTGGVLRINDLALSLNETNGLTPNIGTTKDDQLALAAGGKVFAFGPLSSPADSADDHLAATLQAGDDASLTIRRSVLNWPTPFDFNFMTGQSPSWKRHIYYRLLWNKPSGAKLEMLWRYEQYFYPGNGWASGFMTRKGSTGLISVDIGLGR
ncbi:MAG TPA: hypothetical protein VNY07_00540 [Chthoniobacterales bacterium]|nr:hypothetical protein [Chthoniobacterales bacterium]